jgi:hypothetical protein
MKRFLVASIAGTLWHFSAVQGSKQPTAAGRTSALTLFRCEAPSGPALATLFTTGIPSKAKYLVVEKTDQQQNR